MASRLASNRGNGPTSAAISADMAYEAACMRADSAAHWLRAHAANGGDQVERAFVAGELAAREDIAAARSRAEWPTAWEQARRKKLRRWL